MVENRKAKLVVNKSGSGSTTFRVTIPSVWIRSMGLNEERRDIEISFNGDEIIIRKSSSLDEQ